MSDIVERLRSWMIPHRAAYEIERLRALLEQANDAFDECTGDYPKELVEGEPWRAFRSES